ncbi:MAG: GFA family protein [Lysobacteraceae bacterium]|nr:MAG: GFA family protein [Xanthomonadaceae bacterium]
MNIPDASHRGSCLCGAVSFEVSGPLAPPDICHCRQCRKQSGHVFASTDISRSALSIQSEATLRWYRSSERISRGFCAQCGSSLFWDPIGKDVIAVAMGAFDTPTGTHVKMHIFVADKGDYYDIADGLPQHAH